MAKRLVVFTLLLAAAVSVMIPIIHRLVDEPISPNATTDVAGILGSDDTTGYERAIEVRPLRFPRDHGPHPLFRSEWWYFTGNLQNAAGRRFGYQLTIFRFALRPEVPVRISAWATNQVFMGHFAVTDSASGHFYQTERLSRQALGLAGAEAEPVRVWIENWSIEAMDDDPSVWRLTATLNDVALQLRLHPLKPIVLQGDQGLSQKSAEAGNASYYYSLTRLASQGTLSIGGEAFTVSGESWMDREWSTSALAPDQVGWDWFALQLDDGYELMFYQLRRRSGNPHPSSQGVLVDPRGTVQRLPAQELHITVHDQWKSPTGALYPAQWTLTHPSSQLQLDVRPVLANQELKGSVHYWEGAVDVRGWHRGVPVTGWGYVELTGYGAQIDKRRSGRRLAPR
ncbi:MAG: lipocalin-like domain-containing protein [Gammaproteobacteria bacterium]